MEPKIGQRWEWNEPGRSHLIVEITGTSTQNKALGRCKIVQIYTTSSSYQVGNMQSWEFDDSRWTYLEGQDAPQ